EQRRGEAHRTIAPTLSGNEPRVGPYAIVGKVRADGTILNGWDAAMHRAVWIISQPEDAPEATAARRTLSRLTRLRWVGGRRGAGDSWDAFEAPIGEPLSARLTRDVTWPVQQNWLLDISSEMLAAQADGTSLRGLSADSIWVTPTDRIVFPESAVADSLASASTATNSSLVAQLFERIRAARRSNAPLPGYAVRTIADASATQDPEQIRTLVQATLGRPVAVTRARRAAILVATLTPIVLFSVIGWVSSAQAARVDPKGYTMAGLVSFVSDSARTNADSVKKRAASMATNPKGSYRIARAMESIGLLPVIVPDTITPADTLRRQRQLAEVYLATVLAARAHDTALVSSFGRSESEKKARLAILQRHAVVDSTEARAARQLVDSVWKGVIPGNDLGTLVKFIPYVLLATTITIAAAISLIFGLLVRRGPLMRGFQLDLMTASGAPAGRLRLLIRNVVIWCVVLVPIPSVIYAPRLSISALGTMLEVSGAVFAIIWIAAVWLSLRTPSRGVAERISGTWLVPE
ncbi:MAG: hypothetical protein ABI852_19095, partial [Gemmatimonadaceae bacterium]